MTGAGNPTRGAVPPGEPRWFAVNTQPQREELAALHLLDQGHQVFLPRHARLVRHARKLEQRVTALFPGYLFVRLDPERARWRAVNGTRGVRAILSDGDRPLPVRRGVVEAIMAETGPGGVLAMPDELHTGDRVRVFDGIRLGTPEAAEDIADLSPDRLRAVLGVLAEVTIAPVGKGGKVFKPERVVWDWRRPA